MKLAVIGSRTFQDYELLKKALFGIAITEIVSGGAMGADSLAERFAKENNLPCVVFRPEWKLYGRSAGFIRNQKIVLYCDEMVAFWDGQSRGTKHSIRLAQKAGKTVFIIHLGDSFRPLHSALHRSSH